MSMQGTGEKQIPLAAITSINYRAPTRLTNGFIAFTIAGAQEMKTRGGYSIKHAGKDPNAVALRHKHREDAETLKAAVETAMAQPATQTVGLDRLVELHQQGLLTDDEFAAAKAKELGL